MTAVTTAKLGNRRASCTQFRGVLFLGAGEKTNMAKTNLALRVQANGRTVEMNRTLGIKICCECGRELHEGIGNIQHTKDCTYRTEESDDEVEGGEVDAEAVEP